MNHCRKILYLFLLGLCLLFCACVPRPEIPIPVKEYGSIETSGHRNLLILLRGMGGKADDFEKYGIISEFQSRDLPFDIVVPDAHFGYYRSETIEKRLKHDIIDPARAAGYRKFWLAGFSMGGLGCLFYIREHREDIDGVILVSPFMGWRSIRKEIVKAGGIRQWLPEESTADDWQFIIWSWLHSYISAKDQYPPIFVGYGTEDALTANGPELLSEALDKGNVFTVSGDHDYEAFQAIWAEHLNRLENRLRQLP